MTGQRSARAAPRARRRLIRDGGCDVAKPLAKGGW